MVYLGCCIWYFAIGMAYLVFGMVHFVFVMAYLVKITIGDECAILTQQCGSKEHLIIIITRPSALGMSDPVIESQEIKETQEFPSILKMLKGAKKTKGAKGVKGTMRNGEKQ